MQTVCSMAKLVFLKRTEKEIEIFGGDIYVDIDGKNVGILGKDNLEIELPGGIHTIKMYKSHTYDTFIGFAENTLTLAENEDLIVKYSAPMMVNQSGNMVISQFSLEKIAMLQKAREETIKRDFIKEENRKKEADEKYKKGVTTVIVISIIVAIIWILVDIAWIDTIY